MHLHETNVVLRERVPTSFSITDHVGDASKNAESAMAPISLQLLILLVKLPKVPLVPMIIVIEHGQAE